MCRLYLHNNEEQLTMRPPEDHLEMSKCAKGDQ